MKMNQELSTREQILHMMKTSGPLSTKEITDELGITEMAVRRHLGTMERDGLIESKLVRPTMGRPTAVYGLTEQGDNLFPKKYHTLTLDLLDVLAEETDYKLVDRLFDRRKEKLEQQYKSSMVGKSFEDKVKTLAKIQNDNGYMTKLEQQDENEYILIEHNCPISQIANQYQHACECELKLFESLLDANVERSECLAQEGNCCRYTITKEKSSKKEA
ncbi:putative ArsR family transcriptional regulator [Paenibacillus turicensis]|uniref:ArsR family transcriptional regulator n=1 Tax=Paenibacillus turicensis TaxID=160487 RepID=A0ABS4FPC9_9BACL|nr:metalloregulator ArsR/SmtB family transcription factor [Paenibacillus turicensis]MBP1904434.1 putative ArsR family transcriptional regulator [Paenibacillus turicensis]